MVAVKKLEHTGIMVKDIDASVEFYRTVLGLEFRGIKPHVSPQIKLGFLGFPGDEASVIELIQGYNDNLPSEGKVHHLAFTVDDVEAEAERIRGLGVKFIDDGITTLPNGAKYIFFHGPDGEHLELFQPAK